MIGEERDRPLWLRLPARVAVAAVITFFLGRWVQSSMVDVSYGTAFIVAGIVVLIGIVWAVAIGFPFIERLGEKAGQLYMPSDASFRIRPEYSIAEAHAKAGRYAEAIERFRQDSEQFPNEAFPHIRIAELQVQEFHDVPAAMTELEAALPKTRSADAFVLVSNRLADLALWRYGPRCQQALDYLRQIGRRYPGTKHAKAAAERITRCFP